MNKLFKINQQHPRHLHYFFYKGAPSTPSMPAITPSPPPSPIVAETSHDIAQAKDDEKRKQAQKNGHQSTLLTGANGLGANNVNTQKNTLLGG